MKPTLSEFSIIAILLLIALVAATVGSKVLTITAQSLLDRALEVSNPHK